MVIDRTLVGRFMLRFDGYDKAYGGYDPNRTAPTIRGGKIEIKSTAYTRKDTLTEQMWLNHLDGKTPLGIIPIRENNTCRWGCIDIDDYNTDIPELLRRIAKEQMPLIVCQSKSGGAHLFLFMKKPVAAALMQMCLREMAATLGHGQVEIFPKQRKVEWEKGDFGSWLNMPYFGETRHAYDLNTGTFLTLEQFLDLTDAYAQEPSWLEKDFVEQQNARNTAGSGIKGDTDFGDGPPCLQYLSGIGLSEGNRNNGILNYGVFAKKKYGTQWKDKLDEWNRKYCEPPLSSDEMTGITKRLDKKDFYYRCKDQPIVSHCNAALCRTRKHGVASGTNSMPPIGGLSVMPSDPPLFFLDVGDNRFELTIEGLINYNEFRKVCASRPPFKYYGDMKQSAWGVVIQDLMDNITTIDISPEVGIHGQFTELLIDFIVDTNKADQRDEILKGNPWLDDSDENPDNHAFFFRLKDLRKYLEDNNFKHYGDNLIAAKIRGLGGNNVQLRLQGKPVWVWHVPASFAVPKPRVAPVPPKGSPI